jgi:hypothetical protein
MSASVGGRLEAVERPRSLFGPDYLRLAAVAVVAVAVHGWLIAHTALTARDSLGFARLALCFENPGNAPPHENGRPKNTLDHIRAAEHPPGYPLAVWAADAALKHIVTKPAPERALLATQVANAVAATLLVIPAYLIGRMLFGRNVGFAAALLFQVLPVPARVTSDGLTEGVYLFATATAVMFGVRAVRVPRVSGFLLCGLATGVSYLVRPEGLLVGAGPGAVALWLGLTRAWPREQAFGRLVALCIGVALVSVPYMAVIGKLTNKTTGNYLTDPGAPGPIIRGGGTSKLAATGPALFAEWWNEERDAGTPRPLWAAQAVAKEMSKSANYVIWPLALFALLALRRRFTAEAALWVPLVVVGCNVALLVYLATRAGYVSERHTMLLTFLACQFAAAGLPLLAAAVGQVLPGVERLGVRVTAAGLLAGLVLSSVPFALKPMHQHREAHRRAGEWLATRVTDNDGLLDPYCWAEWYAGRTLYRTSWNPKPSRNTYVVLERDDTEYSTKEGDRHVRLPELATAKAVSKQPTGRIVYQWPEDVPREQAAIFVYKLGPD